NSDTPDPSVSGQTITVAYTVTVVDYADIYPSSGTVTVKWEGTTNVCTGGFTASGQGSCSGAIMNRPSGSGQGTLSISYGNDDDFANCTSATVNHRINKANVEITKIEDPVGNSVLGEPVTIDFTISAASPGSGTPTGNVDITAQGPNNTKSCVDVVLDGSGQGSCEVTLDEVGTWDFDLDYSGDGNFNAKTDYPEWERTVDKAPTSTTIDSVENVFPFTPAAVDFSVSVDFPGVCTPTGNVTVTVVGSVLTCTGTVADGFCDITFDGYGYWVLNATYAGNANCAGSTSADYDHWN
ncbi:MAG: Ig-like domain-containing protein, partial [Anaerolineaceae bacterium]|nr:Ig-like domain-containing protein [Anaerolineaceae bacterium]